MVDGGDAEQAALLPEGRELHGGRRWARLGLLGLGVCGAVAACCALKPPAARLDLGSGRAGVVELSGGLGLVGKDVTCVQTSASGERLAWQPSLTLDVDFAYQGTVVEIDTGVTDQALKGFGGAFTEAAAVTFGKLNETLQEVLLEQYFGETGLGYTMGRVHINSCDFSLGSYSFDDHEGDFQLEHFDSTLAHDQQALIPLIKRAKAKVEGGSGHVVVRAVRDIVTSLEKLEALSYPRGLVSLTGANGKFWSVEPDGSVTANRDKADDWEKFYVVPNSDGTVSLESYSQKAYLVARPDGKILASAKDTQDPCARFSKVENGDGTISLKTCSGKFASADGARTLALLATPWSPPAWMKTSGEMVGSGATCLREDARKSWALYITKWISAYKAQRIPIWGLTVQNEPMVRPSWEGCLMSSEDEAGFLGDHLGPAMRSAHPEVKILVHDDQKHLLPVYVEASLLHPKSAEYVDGAAFHWYSGDHFDVVDSMHRLHPELLLLASEATYEKRMWEEGRDKAYPDWRFGEGYAHDIIGDLNAGAVGWIDWNLLLDKSGGPNHVGNVCDAAMVADPEAQTVELHPQYHYVGHFSKFMPPGSRRVSAKVWPGKAAYATSTQPGPYGTCTGLSGLEVTAFVRPDNQIALVVLNCADEAIEFKLRIDGAAVKARAPQHAIQTYLLPGAGAAADDTPMAV